MSKLKILHLSDLHLAATYNRAKYKAIGSFQNTLSVYNNDALIALAKFVYIYRNRLDGILISGDIVVTGTDKDLTFAIEFFNSPSDVHSEAPWLNSKGKPTLHAFKKPIIIIPGNHDRYSSIITGSPGNLFYNYFSSYWDVGAGGIKTFYLPNEESPTLAIVCSDFTLADSGDCTVRLGHFGQGMIYPHRLDELEDATNRVKETHDSCAIIWMIHFAPKYEEQFKLSERMRLINSDDLIEKAEKVGVKYVFCGHTHRNRPYTVKKNHEIKINCAGSSSCDGPEDDTTIHLREIEINDGEVVQIFSQDYPYNAGKGSFLD